MDAHFLHKMELTFRIRWEQDQQSQDQKCRTHSERPTCNRQTTYRSQKQQVCQTFSFFVLQFSYGPYSTYWPSCCYPVNSSNCYETWITTSMELFFLRCTPDFEDIYVELKWTKTCYMSFESFKLSHFKSLIFKIVEVYAWNLPPKQRSWFSPNWGKSSQTNLQFFYNSENYILWIWIFKGLEQ